VGKLRSVFFGTPEFSLNSFFSCVQNSECLAVVTQPDKPKGRGLAVTPSPIKKAALDLNLPVFQPEKLGTKGGEAAEQTYSNLVNLKPDVFLVTAYGNLLPERFLSIPRVGCFNVHASLLPRWRGAAPIQRSIEAGDKETGVCIQKMVLELDAGDIVLSLRVAIEETEDSDSLFKKLSKASRPLTDSFFDILNKNPAVEGIKQEDSKVTFAHKISKSESIWNVDWTSVQTFNRTRAFSNWPGVKISFQEIEPLIALIECKPLNQSNLEASIKPVRVGELHVTNNKAILVCKDSELVELLKVKPAGGQSISALDYFKSSMGNKKLSTLTVKRGTV
jgi:methionyl-tRNA formyltransferase